MSTPTYELISTTSGSGNTITISSIPNTFRDLVFVCDFGGTGEIIIRLNGDTGSNYSWQAMHGDGTNTQAIAASTDSYIDTRMKLLSSQRGLVVMNLMDYSQTNKHKTALIRANNANQRVVAVSSRWANTSAVTSIAIRAFQTNDSISGTFSLYGIAG